jgi:hypothetical protein
MIATDRQRRDARGDDGAIEVGDFRQGAGQFVGLLDPAIA